MTFLHPWAIVAGILAAGLPIAVHFMTRPRPVRLPISTLRFLREAIHQRRARNALRDILILLLRTCAVLLIALAIARPQWGARPLVSDQLEGDTVRIVALDVSQSMAATDRGVAAIERARTRAAEFLRYRPGLKANLLLVGADSRGVFDTPSVNFEQLLKELADAEVLPQRVDARKFSEAAARMLAPVSPDDNRRRELVVISDFQRSGWAGVDLASLPEGTQIQWESVASSEPLPNLGIRDVRVRAEETSAGPSICEIDVYNGTPNQRLLDLELRIGESLWNLKANCRPEAVTTISQELQWKQSGWQSGEVRLLDLEDALAADDVRYFAVQIPTEPVYALITRQPASQRPSSSWFLESVLAIRQTPQDGATVENSTEEKIAGVRRFDPAELDSMSLGQADLILLDHPGKLNENTIKMLAGFLRRGRPMLYVASESVDAVNLKSLLEAAGESVQLPVEFVPPPAGTRRRDLSWSALKRDRPPFSVFGDHLGGLIRQLRFSGGLDSRRLEGRHTDDLLAVYNDGSAAIVSASSDIGALAIINADLNESNLPRTAVFVPLVEELVRGLISRQRGGETAFCGEPVFIQLPADAGPSAALDAFELNATGQNRAGERNFGELIDEETGTVWSWPRPERPGVYGIKRGDQVVFAKAVAIPPEESELESLDLENLASRLAGGHATYYRHVSEGQGGSHDSLWIWLNLACVLCMLGELGVMILFRD